MDIIEIFLMSCIYGSAGALLAIVMVVFSQPMGE